ncbi:dihydrofolate reductase [Candidatus Vallotia cooleyia]|uniref:dihydrofolate reductase n=1 Tax=Candidatus Vallotiella adelgis TaxID=1177211 RepID=UPI001D02A0A5|nr:dihydrofolate reductase [Candidatus Vallotia cooleyia]UDG82057.1 Dihydrofolate reductase type 3 [Candidatus Vallotia cooleyia]
MTTLCLIVARARNGVIGHNNTLPWQLPEDLLHFKNTTMGSPLIMGRKTHESIGHALPGRRNIVVTRDAAKQFHGCDTVTSLDAARALCEMLHAPLAYLIGGAQLYREGIRHAERLIVTEIDRVFEGDATFSTPSVERWREVSRKIHQTASPSNLIYAFVEYERISY